MSYDEFAFIDRLMRPLAAGMPAALDLADDAAVLEPPEGRELVLTKDALVAGVHFLPDDPADLVAAKLLRVNLSDLAAMGAEPLGYLLLLAKPREIADDWLEAFSRGLARDQERFGLALMGGDTVSTPGPLTLSLTALGTVPRGRALLRRGARVGDDLWVSGTLGEAAIGLRILRGLALPDEDALPFIARYRMPEPRIALGLRLRGLAHAVIDVSDGLVADAGHLAHASGAAVVIEAPALPVSARARRVPGAMDCALAGGDDYELLFSADPGARGRIAELAAELGLPLTRIGRIEEGEGVQVRDEKGRPVTIQRPGWRHF